jgi:hypothetical protein
MKPDLLDKSWFRSKKFLAFVVMELFMEGLAVLALLTQPGLGWPLAAFMLGLVITQGAVAFAFTGQQAALDKYLRGMAITASVSNPNAAAWPWEGEKKNAETNSDGGI